MQLVADRFVGTGRPGEALDLATGARVRLFVDMDVTRGDISVRAAICDRLAMLRHPLRTVATSEFVVPRSIPTARRC